MLFLTIAALILSTVLSIWAIYQINKTRKQQITNMFLAEGLDNLLNAAKVEVAKNKKLVEKARSMVDYSTAQLDPSSPSVMDDPAMLATLVTVIVKKFGTMRLGMPDFTSLPDDQFVSLYVDTNTQELLLSLRDDLEEETAAMMDIINFSGKDDGTYH